MKIIKDLIKSWKENKEAQTNHYKNVEKSLKRILKELRKSNGN
jgi:hypothetical protein